MRRSTVLRLTPNNRAASTLLIASVSGARSITEASLAIVIPSPFVRRSRSALRFYRQAESDIGRTAFRTVDGIASDGPIVCWWCLIAVTYRFCSTLGGWAKPSVLAWVRVRDTHLAYFRTVTTQLAEQLQEFVLQRKNILICGGTSCGKTTLANALTEFIPNHARIVLIEDTAEIQIQKDNVLRFEARHEQNGLPAVTIRDLLKATLRHRPDRIILGEIRGGEAFDLLQLLNTGHSGTISTVHANSAAQGISRFTTCVLQSGVEIPYRAIKTNIADSLNIIVQMDRRPGMRFVSEVLEIRGYSQDADQYDFDKVYVRKTRWHESAPSTAELLG